MPVSAASLPLDGAVDVTAWMATTLEGWGLPGRLARGWLPAVEQGLRAPGARELGLEHDGDLGLVSVEVRGAGGEVLVGLDDLVGGVVGAA